MAILLIIIGIIAAFLIGWFWRSEIAEREKLEARITHLEAANLTGRGALPLNVENSMLEEIASILKARRHIEEMDVYIAGLRRIQDVARSSLSEAMEINGEIRNKPRNVKK
jgi:hypothetical protein